MAVKLKGAMYWNRRQRVIPAIMIITKKRDLSNIHLSAVQILSSLPNVFNFVFFRLNSVDEVFKMLPVFLEGWGGGVFTWAVLSGPARGTRTRVRRVIRVVARASVQTRVVVARHFIICKFNLNMLGTCTWFTQAFAQLEHVKYKKLNYNAWVLKNGINSWIFFLFNKFSGISIYMFATLCIHKISSTKINWLTNK